MKKIIRCTLLGLIFCVVSQAQTVATLVNSSNTKFRDDIIISNGGELFCADYGGSNIYKLNRAGVVSVFATGFNTPNGLAFDSNQNLFVCDNIGNRIYKLDIEGNFLDTFNATFPSGIIKEFDSDTMIITQYGSNHTLSKLAPDGQAIVSHVNNGLNGPVGLEYDNLGQLYVANFNDRKIFKVFSDTLIHWATVPGPAGGRLGFLAYGGGRLWATSWQDQKIYGVSTMTRDSTFHLAGSVLGSTDGPIAEATFNSPNGIYANPSGDTIYISEYNTGKLRIIKPNISHTYATQIQKELSIFPNPAQNSASIQIECNSQIDHLMLTNAEGKLINNFQYDKSTNQLIINNSGVHFLHIVSQDVVIIKKIMIIDM